MRRPPQKPKKSSFSAGRQGPGLFHSEKYSDEHIAICKLLAPTVKKESPRKNKRNDVMSAFVALVVAMDNEGQTEQLEKKLKDLLSEDVLAKHVALSLVDELNNTGYAHLMGSVKHLIGEAGISLADENEVIIDTSDYEKESVGSNLGAADLEGCYFSSSRSTSPGSR